MATTSLSQAFKDTNLSLKHLIPLDFDSVHELPESHSWAPSDDFSRACQIPTNKQPVPVIDLKSPNAVELIGDACRRWGMFQVTNHGVPSNVVDNVEAHARRLFALPVDQKLRALRSPTGATGYGLAKISPFFSKLMWHEGFTIMGSAVDHAKLLWPHRYEEFCDAMENYQKTMNSLACKILVIILKSLGVAEEASSSAFLHQSEGVLQLNSYPSCPNPSQAIGLAPHTDSLLLTILHQNDTTGLQISQEDDDWMPVPSVPGALIVNLGDLMHILSNASFPSAYHRVVPNDTRHRFTVAYFYAPPADSMVAPLSKLPSPRFRAVSVKEYLALKNKHLGKAFEFIRV